MTEQHDNNDELMRFSFDKYGGVEIDASPSSSSSATSTSTPDAFAEELRRNVDGWKAAHKRGLWLRIPLAAAATAVGPAAAQGFVFHHALPGYVMMTRWLPADDDYDDDDGDDDDAQSQLPRYGFTQIGVGGVVFDTRGRVLMVQERVSPVPRLQGSWKLPGGLADPGEDFCETAAREVYEETGVVATGNRLLSLRHSHGYRFGQSDLYAVVVMEGSGEIRMSDELMGARWMTPEEIEERVAPSSSSSSGSSSLDGKVSETNWKVIRRALERDGPTIVCERARTSRPTVKQPMLYMAADSSAGASLVNAAPPAEQGATRKESEKRH